MKVSEILQVKGNILYTITPDQPLVDAANTMAEKDIGSLVVITILYFGRVFFITSIVAVIIAFILEPFVALLMRVRFPRTLASFVVCAAALLV